MQQEDEEKCVWNTVNFVTAEPGWVVLYKTADDSWTEPLPGWLVQEQVFRHGNPTWVLDRRVVGAYVQYDGLVPISAEYTKAFVGIFGPGQDLPTDPEAARQAVHGPDRDNNRTTGTAADGFPYG